MRAPSTKAGQAMPCQTRAMRLPTRLSCPRRRPMLHRLEPGPRVPQSNRASLNFQVDAKTFHSRIARANSFLLQ